jgi:hypothetical protein
MLSTKFQFIWSCGFRGEDFLEINQSETRIACGGHVFQRIETKWAIFIEDIPRMLPTKFRFIWPSGFRGKDFFRNRPIRNKNCLWRTCLLTDRDEMRKLYRGPSIDASCQVLIHLAERFQRRRLKCEKLTDDRRRTTDTKWWQKLTLPLARWAKNPQGGMCSFDRRIPLMMKSWN